MPELNDPYLDEGTGILRNLVGATTWAELAEAEADLTFVRAVELNYLDLPGTRDIVELKAIHHQLFQDLYPWAGEVRTVDIRRTSEGFLPAVAIDRASSIAAGDLRTEHYLKGRSRENFIARLAHHYDQFNYIHPFREGNGRTQRIFWSRVAADAGWRMDWTQADGEVNDRASRLAAEERDLKPLKVLLGEVVQAQLSPEWEVPE
ncbi:Fic/DOC family protein [Corynebacterium sp. A21]|uniref:Fic/DOC family protein n=1 Tax=Corynebacterium sp. A21 TaxID=3457318 RepID=UPI003FD23D9E